MDVQATGENSGDLSTTSSNAEGSTPVPVLFSSPSECCGCGACAAACPVQAISFFEDEFGYRYPRIDESVCIRCGRCKQVCGYQRAFVSESNGNTYAAATTEPEINQSASGGIFGALARAMLTQGGVVAGCKYENCDGLLYACHQVIDDASELPALLGSKYVQSETGDVYPRIRKILVDGGDVLFSGTPCQIAGLRGYLGEKLWNSEHLLTIDLVCHGVPNQEMLRGYLSEIQEDYPRDAYVIDAQFRPKNDGWEDSRQLKLVFSDASTKSIRSDNSSYYDAFFNLKTIRESCYSCPFAGRQRPADLTMGDFWGIEKQCPELLEDAGGPFSLFSGVSCLLVNSECGMKWLEKLGSNLTLREVEFGAIAAHNEQLKAPAKRPKDRDSWLEAFAQGGWPEVERLWRKDKRKQALRRRAAKLIPGPAKRAIKAVIGR